MCNYIKLPDRPAVAGLLNYGDQITISDVRVVKRGEPYDRGFGANPTKGFPVRVDFKGMRIASYGKMVGSMGEIVHDKDVNLPFEGQTDFDIERQPADRTKVDPGPGKWIASPAK